LGSASVFRKPFRPLPFSEESSFFLAPHVINPFLTLACEPHSIVQGSRRPSFPLRPSRCSNVCLTNVLEVKPSGPVHFFFCIPFLWLSISPSMWTLPLADRVLFLPTRHLTATFFSSPLVRSSGERLASLFAPAFFLFSSSSIFLRYLFAPLRSSLDLW